MTDTTKKILEIISNAENINRLPLLEDLRSELNDKDFNEDYSYFCECFDEEFDEIAWKEIKIKDGTKITLEKCVSDTNCFDDNDHWYFYHVKENDTYICMDCGLRQKDYGYMVDEFCCSVLLPAYWNKKGVEIYLKRRAEREEKKSRERCLRYEERLRLYADCSNCIHMKNAECEYGNDDLEYEGCEYWEGR